jgi:uncharacterized protein
MIEKYSKLVSYNSGKLLLIIILITIIAINLSFKVGTKSMDNKDMLPDNIEVIKAFSKLEDNFGGSDSILIVIELNSLYPLSNEIRDLREPDAIRYIYTLTEVASRTNDVISANSAGTIIYEMNNYILPNNINDIKLLIEKNPALFSYTKYNIAIIDIKLSDSYNSNSIVSDLEEIISQISAPPGIVSRVGGEVATGPVMEEIIGPDMGRTSRFSLVGIMIVLFLVFFSIRYAIKPLIVIGIGIIWAFGYFGLVGIDLSPITSGAISMIMGIGIDFGIQTITRFRHELKKSKPEKAMEETINNVFKPMLITTLAALIGFQAMSMGDLKVLQELGTMMSYGVLFCFFSAITVIPALAINGEKIFGGKKNVKNK